MRDGIVQLCYAMTRKWCTSLSDFARFANLYKDAHLVIAGPVEDNSLVIVNQQIGDFGIQVRICFTGYIKVNVCKGYYC